MALAKAYNGASLGGVVFSPLWVLLIAQLGFTAGAGLVGLVMVAVMALLSFTVFTRTPEQLGQRPDGEDPGAPAPCPAPSQVRALAGRLLWRNRRFLSLALGMAAGLFAQIGLLAHLFSVLVPALGARAAGWAMGFATACAIAGRMFVARLLPAGTHRRVVAALAYGVQLAGSIVLLCVDAQQVAWILLGVALFGSGIGNATSLPPLIAQAEFAREDVPRVVALIVAMAQASYAFAPAVFGFVLSAAGAGGPHLGVNTSAFLLTVDLKEQRLNIRPVTAEPRPGKSYQLWIKADELGPNPRSVGVLGNDFALDEGALSNYDPALLKEATFGISVEPEGGSPTGQPTGPAIHGYLYPTDGNN
mgnify:CR=1 FL=1